MDEIKKSKVYPKIGGKYKHYKGGSYEVITLAKHTETDETMVVYKSLEFGSIYTRPLSVWEDVVNFKYGTFKDENGVFISAANRFEKID